MGKATFVPITPSVLHWAIDEAGVDLPEVARSAGVDTSDVSAWLRGDAEPTKTQFKALSRFLKRPTSFFFLPSPPEQAALPAAFRHPPGGSREPTQIELEQLRKARRVQQIGKWLAKRVGDGQWARHPAPAVRSDASPDAAALIARRWLDWSVQEQQEAQSPTALVKLFRARLEERGVLTLQLSLGRKGARGFSLYDDQKPLVAINTHYNAAARAYSYGHELGHLMRRKDAVCIGYAATKAERWCEEFAASFLLPADALRVRLEHRFGTERLIGDLDDVRKLARDFNVSLTATAIRLENLGWGREGLFGLIPKNDDDKGKGFGAAGTDNTRGAVRRRELGDAYFYLVTAGERSGALERQDVLRYLDVSEKHLRQIKGETPEPFEP